MKPYVMLLIILGMSLFGCSTHYEANYNASVNGSAGAQNVSTAPSGTQPSHVNTTPPAGTSPPASVNVTNTSSGADLSGMNYSDLLIIGSPSTCSVSYANEQHSYKINLFFDGNGAMRMEDPSTGDPDCPLDALVFKGDLANGGVAYMNCPTNKGILGDEFGTDTPCDWLSTNISSEYGGIGSFSWGIVSYSTLPLDMVPNSGYDCKPWAADSTKFDTAGHICYQ